MKFIAGIALSIMSAVPVLAQNFEPTVTWKVSQGKNDGNLTEIIFNGTIASGWHTYGIDHKASPPAIEFTDLTGCTLEGGLYELLPKSDYNGD